MSLLNFPTNPLVGDTYTIGTNTWVWNGTAWVKLSSSSISPIVISTLTLSTSTITGSVVITGGMGVGGSVNIEGTSTINGSIILTTSTFQEFSNLQAVTDNGNSTTNVVIITNQTSSTNTESGSLIVVGGVGIGKSLNVGGSINATLESTVGGAVILTSSTYQNFVNLQGVTEGGSTTTQVVTFQNTVYFTDETESASTDTGAVIISGGLGVAKRINSESIQIADTVIDSTETYINTSSTTLIDSFSSNDYRSAKYFIQISHGVGGGAEFEAVEMVLLVDNSNQTYMTIYGNVSNNGSLGAFTASVTATVVGLYFTPVISTEKHVRIFRTGMKV